MPGIIEDILAVQPEPPYLIGGYSFGSMVAFEIAQQLYKKGKTVELLAILDKPGLHFICQYYVKFKYYQSLSIIHKFEHIKRKIKRTISQINLKRKTTICTESNGLVKPILQSYFFQSYPGQITIFFARDSHINTWLFPQGGWDRRIVRQVQVYTVPANHFTMLKDPQVQVLAEKLKACIDKTQENNSDHVR